MKNAFVKTYEFVKTLNVRMDAATTDDERNAICKEYQDATAWIDEQGNFACTIWNNCQRTFDNGNSRIDLNDNISSKNIVPFIECLRKNGVTEFTFSSTWSSAVDTAWLLQQNGCTLSGLVEINGDRIPFTKEHEKLHAYLFKLI